MSTVERVVQFVSAHLYRAPMRSAVAEAAWADATTGDAYFSASPDGAAEFIRAARDRAVEIIAGGKHPPSITESALDTLDHAIYAALAEARVDDASSPTSTATGEAMQPEQRS